MAGGLMRPLGGAGLEWPSWTVTTAGGAARLAVEVRRCLPLRVTGDGNSGSSCWRRRERNQLD